MTKKSISDYVMNAGKFIGEKAKDFYNHINDNKKVYGLLTALTVGGMIGKAQSKKDGDLTKGFNYGYTINEKEKYNISADTIHGAGYVGKETEVSRKNPTGNEIYPENWESVLDYDYVVGENIEGLESNVIYIPQKTGLTEVILMTEEDSSIFSLPSATREASNGHKRDITGGKYDINVIIPNFKLKTYKAPTGQVFYAPYVSPESNLDISNGEALPFLLVDSATTTLPISFNSDGKPVLRNPQGNIYIPKLTKKSDRSKVLATKTEEVPYFAEIHSSEDSLTGDLANYFTEVDTSNGVKRYIYEIPKSENVNFADSVNITLIEDSVPRARKVESGQNLVLNSNYPDAYKDRIKSAEQQTGEAIWTTDIAKPNGKKDFHILGFVADNTRMPLEVSGYMGGGANPTSGASGKAALQVKAGNAWVGGFVKGTPEYFSTSTNSFTKSESPKTTLLDIDGAIDGVHTEVYDQVDSSMTVNSTSSVPFSYGAQVNIPVGENSELEIMAGTSKKNTTTSTTGTKDVKQWMEIKDGNTKLEEVPLMESVHLQSDQPVVETTSENVPFVGLGYKYSFGKNNRSAIGVSGTWKGDGDVSAEISYTLTIGGKKKK